MKIRRKLSDSGYYLFLSFSQSLLSRAVKPRNEQSGEGATRGGYIEANYETISLVALGCDPCCWLLAAAVAGCRFLGEQTEHDPSYLEYNSIRLYRGLRE